jgi:hypothetical protein
MPSHINSATIRRRACSRTRPQCRRSRFCDRGT